MSTTQPFEAVNLAGATWTEGGRRASFAAERPGFGVRCVETGLFIESREGGQPAVWGTKKIAAVIAEYPHADGTLEVEFS